MLRWSLPILAVVLLVPAAARAQVPDEKKIDAIVQDALKALDAPGAAVAVVHQDKVVYLKGAGVRELGKDEPVTADTVFQIASCTKAFLALLIAILVGEGRIDWDDPVRKHVPFFHLDDPLADQNVTIRDLLCHRTGLSRHDLLWYKSLQGPEDVIRKVGLVKSTTSFRSTWEYANIPFMTAGTAVSLIEKRPLGEIFRDRIFQPLGMKHASAFAADFLKVPDRATPHRRAGATKLEVTQPLIYDSRGAGDISASARDLAQWLRFQLGDGTFDGKRLLPAKHFQEPHAPQMVVKPSELMKQQYPDDVATHFSYGLGWHVQDYRGHPMISHGGSLPGFRTLTVLMPRAKLGIVVMTNRNPSFLPEAVTKTVVDQFLQLPDKGWDDYYVKLDKKQTADKQNKEAETQAKRKANTKPSLELEAYAGTFDNAAYGKATISAGKDGLEVQWGSHKAPLGHWHFDTFRCLATGEFVLEGEFLTFALNTDGEVASLRWLGQEFRRDPPAAK